MNNEFETKFGQPTDGEGGDATRSDGYAETLEASAEHAEGVVTHHSEKFGMVNASAGSGLSDDLGPKTDLTDDNCSTQQTTPKAIPLASILAACPAIAGYGRNGIGNWNDLIDAAGVAGAAIGGC